MRNRWLLAMVSGRLRAGRRGSGKDSFTRWRWSGLREDGFLPRRPTPPEEIIRNLMRQRKANLQQALNHYNLSPQCRVHDHPTTTQGGWRVYEVDDVVF